MNRLRDLRTQRDITLEALAELMDTSPQQLGRLETGKRRMTVAWLQRAAAALGVPAVEIDPDLARTIVDPSLAQRRADDLERAIEEANQEALQQLLGSGILGKVSDDEVRWLRALSRRKGYRITQRAYLLALESYRAQEPMGDDR